MRSIRLKLVLPLIGAFALSQCSVAGDQPAPKPRPRVVAFAEAGPPAPAPAPAEASSAEPEGPRTAITAAESLASLTEAPRPVEHHGRTPRTPADHWASPPIVQTQATKAVDITPPSYVLPLVQLNAPSSVEVGDMIVISATVDKSRSADDLQQVKFQWTVIEDGKVKSNAIVWPDGSKIFFAAGMKPKNYVVFLDVDCLFGVAKTVDGVTSLTDAQVESPDMIATTITVGGGPIPGPDPGPDPSPTPTPTPTPTPDPTFEDGTYKLAAFTYNTLKADPGLTADEKAKLGAALTPCFEGTAAKIVAVSDYNQPANILGDLKAANVAAIAASGVDPAKVAAFNKALGDQIYKLYTSDKTLNVADDFATAFREIAAGLKAFGGGPK